MIYSELNDRVPKLCVGGCVRCRLRYKINFAEIPKYSNIHSVNAHLMTFLLTKRRRLDRMWKSVFLINVSN